MEMEMAFSVFVLFTSCSFWLCLIKMYRMCARVRERETKGVCERGSGTKNGPTWRSYCFSPTKWPLNPAHKCPKQPQIRMAQIIMRRVLPACSRVATHTCCISLGQLNRSNWQSPGWYAALNSPPACPFPSLLFPLLINTTIKSNTSNKRAAYSVTLWGRF